MGSQGALLQSLEGSLVGLRNDLERGSKCIGLGQGWADGWLKDSGWGAEENMLQNVSINVTAVSHQNSCDMRSGC